MSESDKSVVITSDSINKETIWLGIKLPNTLKDWLEVASFIAKGSYITLFSSGVLASAVYCMRIHFLPRISLGDTFLLLVIPICAASLHAALFVIGLVSTIWLFRLLFMISQVIERRRHKRSLPSLPEGSSTKSWELTTWARSGVILAASIYASIVFGLMTALQFLIRPTFSHSPFIEAMPSYMGAGLLAVIFLGTKRSAPLTAKEHESSNKLAKYVYLSIATFIVLPMLYSGGALLDMTMSAIGVRVGNDRVVMLNGKNHSKLTAIAKLYSSDLKICPGENPDMWFAQGLGVDWHGVGSIDRVHITVNDGKSRISFDLGSDGISPIVGDAYMTLHCP